MCHLDAKIAVLTHASHSLKKVRFKAFWWGSAWWRCIYHSWRQQFMWRLSVKKKKESYTWIPSCHSCPLEVVGIRCTSGEWGTFCLWSSDSYKSIQVKMRAGIRVGKCIGDVRPQSKESSAHLSRKAKGKSKSFEVWIAAVIFRQFEPLGPFPSHIGLDKEPSPYELQPNTFIQTIPALTLFSY